MKTCLLLIVACCLAIIANSQNCDGNSFPGITQPSTCTYTYTSTGWVDALGLPTVAPNSCGSSESICILSDYTGDLNFNIKGTLYIAPNVVYTGAVSSFGNSTLLVEGRATFTNTPGFAGNDTYIGANGEINMVGTLNPQGDATVNNAGIITATGDFNMGGQARFVSYPDSKVVIGGDAQINAEFDNCGLLDVSGSLSSGGASGLKNLCSTYIRTDMILNADYTNYGLIIIDGSLNFGSSNFINENTLVVENIDVSNVDLVGNDDDSLLIVKNNAVLSSNGTITGHMFYDVNDGGGFDTVCGSCVEETDIVLDITIPPTTEEVLQECGGNVIVNPVIEKSQLDFDGVDDYLSTSAFLNGSSTVTIMAWVNSDAGNSTHMTIAGEDIGCRLWLKNGNTPVFTIKGSGVSVKNLVSPSVINLGEWHHIAGVYDSTTGSLKLYIDGAVVNTTSISSGAQIANVNSNGNFEIGRRSSNVTNKEYFKGDIDEVRVFNTAITDSQLQKIVYQEIESNSGAIRGSVIAKDIVDSGTGTGLSWNSLLAYYPMTDVVSYYRTTDFSLNNRVTKLHNITSMQDQTAPMPYVTNGNGCWCSASTWLHGNVWDITNVSSNKDWSIIEIKHDVTASHDIKTLGLLIDTGKTLTVSGDSEVRNNWYLELNGTLDLIGDSQLLQTEYSDLVTSSNGKILRRQEGASSPYWYNYWSSPVGQTSASALSDNNTAAHNGNNTSFKLDMLKDGTGSSCLFTSAQTSAGKISKIWLYTFKNGVTYWDWAEVATSTPLSPGVGYTQKGTGNGGSSQQYIFEGKPNNGTILVDVTDKGGPGSEANKTKTQYLLGNPYASALDVHQFIDDNAGVIDGTIYLWQQWAGGSHYLNEYQGGYAQVNKTGSCRAYQFVGFYGDNNGSQDGTIVPTRYLPVGQGFMAEIIADGQVEFNNAQRVFVKESDADGSYTNGSVFSKSTNGKASKTSSTAQSMQKVRLDFSSVSGPKTRRELLLGFSNYTTDGYDYGYDAKSSETNNNDLSLSLDNQDMTIQAYGEITADKVVPLNFKSSGNNTFEVKISETENLEDNQPIYLRDNQTGTYFNLTDGAAYQFSSEAGVFNNRFEIVFQEEQQSLSMEEALASENYIYFQKSTNTFYAKKLNSEVKQLALVNMRGQRVLEMSNVSKAQLTNGIRLDNVPTGAYVVCLRTETNDVISKKIVVN